MKTTQLLTLFALLCAVTFSTFAQDNDEWKERKHNYGTHNYFDIDLGINNYLEAGSHSAVESNSPYAVKPWGSWYIALKTTNDTHVGGPLHLLWGADVSWYNFKFENERLRLAEGPDGIVFTEATGEFSPVKSKLTAAYIDASLVPMLKFGESRHDHHHRWNCWGNQEGFRIGAGGYAGYKIASYAKYVVKDNGDRNKNRDKDGFYLNNFRYGVRVQLGFRDMDVFVNYDMNELFAENRGPKLNAFSFGVVL